MESRVEKAKQTMGCRVQCRSKMNLENEVLNVSVENRC